MAHTTVSTGPYEVGRIKSFSQKSGWGFIQLFDNGVEDSEGCKDVFFHRADVVKTGSCEVRPGVLVQCKVVSTGKGEKASDINLVDDVSSEPAPTRSLCTCPQLSTHSPYHLETLSIVCGPLVSAASASRYSLRSTGNLTTWQCIKCNALNSIPCIQRVMVICPDCSIAHQVQSWICACSHMNKRGTRHCANCDQPFSKACHELCVEFGSSTSGQALAQPSGSPARRAQRLRSRWQHGPDGWAHTDFDAPATSLWCQDGSGAGDFRRKAEVHGDFLIEKCRLQLEWAHTVLTGRAPSEHIHITPEWLYGLSKELAAPERRLLCETRGCTSFAPNRCADVEDATVVALFEVLGMLIALAVALKMPLYPILPMWLARSLLGYPTTVEDLAEFNAAAWQRVEAVRRCEDVETLGLYMEEEVMCGDVTRVFRHMNAARVTSDNKGEYLAWLKDVHLCKVVEPQLKKLKHGFLYALMGHHLMQTLTPTTLVHLINGETM